MTTQTTTQSADAPPHPSSDAPGDKNAAQEPADAQSTDGPPANEPESARPTPAFQRTVGSLTVALTGATGFVGSHVCETLAQHGHNVRALVRSDRKLGNLPRAAKTIQGDVTDRASLDALVDKADVCIHLVGIIFENPRKGITCQRLHVEATRNVVDACQSAGILRYVHMSALGARADTKSVYHRTKYEAEQIVRDSNLAWTIFRPSMIIGPDGEFSQMTARWVRGTAPPFLFIPYFGAGAFGTGRKFLVQPVDVHDVAELFVRAFETRKSIGEIYPLGGPEKMTWPEMFDHFRAAIAPDSRKRGLAIPAWKALAVARIARFLSLEPILPFTVDQVIMSQEDAICSNARVKADFLFEPRRLADALASFASRL